jgi:putative effector of murein hydrolase
MKLSEWLRNPAFSIALTVLAYWLALQLHRRRRWLPPIVVACVPIVAVLLLFREPYAEYNRGGSWLTWWLGPATVALVVLAGSVVGMVTAGLTAHLLGAPLPVVMSAVPKSVTTPIAIEVSRELKGIPQITIALVILAGVLGATFGPLLLRLAGVRGDLAIGAAMGTASHGIGTASLVRHSELQASVSSWAMAAAGVCVSLMAALMMLFLR